MSDATTAQDASLPLVTTTQHTTESEGVGNIAGGLFSKETMMNFLPIVLIFAVFYFFIIRPQIKKQKEQEALVKSSKKGDKVIVGGGIIGKIFKEKEEGTILLEVAKDVHIEVLKSSIVSIMGDKVQSSVDKKK